MQNHITSLPPAKFIPCDLPSNQSSEASGYKFVTDAYLVSLAKENNCQFATLDEGILQAEWANGIAYRPFSYL